MPFRYQILTIMKFNLLKRKTKQTTNYQGAKAWTLTPELELYTAVVTASLTNKFYEKEGKRLTRIKHLIGQCDPTFVAKLAIYTREKMYLRSIPIVLVAELAKIHSGDSLIKNTVARVVKRADEITELLAYYQFANDRKYNKKLNKLSKQIQKGLGAAFNNFDEYQFAKYNRAGEVTLKDALFLVHPKAKDNVQQAIFDKIVKDTLTTPYTWEVELSKVGQESYDSDAAKARAFTAKWEELIDSGRLGYMALMRNLRNILQADVSADHIKKVAATLADEKKISRAKQLPFRYLSAYRELDALKLPYVNFLMDALETAVQVSVENIKGFDLSTKVVLASDVSGSMYSQISKNSKIQNYDIGLVLSMLLRNRSKNVFTGIFGDRWEMMNLPASNILANTMKLRKMEGRVGYSTNGYKVIDDLVIRRLKVDKVMFFTDLQMWDSRNDGNSLQKSWSQYTNTIAPNAKLYLFDLAGYGQSPISIPHRGVHLIAGWSNKIFEVLEAMEKGGDAISEINKITIVK